MNHKTIKCYRQTQNVDVNSNIGEKKNSLARITQSKQNKPYFHCSPSIRVKQGIMKNNLYDSQSIIKPTNISYI